MEKVIEIAALTKSFTGTTVLDGIDMFLGKGETLVVIGKSGEGKSVTLKCIIGMTEADSGSIRVFGKEVTSMNEEELLEFRKKVGFLFQGGALYDSMSVMDNMEFPLRKVLKMTDNSEIRQRCQDTLDAVGLGEVSDKRPSSLSGGMRKRMALARTLVVHPQVILYDEPTTGLDTITSGEISELILELQEKYNTSSLIITHDMSCAKITADRIIVLSGGKCSAEGTFDQLKQHDDPGVRAFFKSF